MVGMKGEKRHYRPEEVLDVVGLDALPASGVRFVRRPPGMDETTPAKKSCPECGSNQYQFRSRKKVAGEHGGAVETKYRCKACGHEWRVAQRA
jgi:DNA-directed RNA polymerase subunit M/transcription elongation factor TFIIS